VDWNELFPAGEPVIALPNWDRPRLLVSARLLGRRWRDSAFYPAHRLLARGYKLLLRARTAVRIGQIRYATGGNSTVAEFLRGLVDDPQVPVVQIGTTCAAQKWTLRVADGAGKIRAYIKCGKSNFALNRLANEYKVLGALPKGMGPRLMKFGALANGSALCIAPLAGRPLRSDRSQWRPQLADFLERLNCHTPLDVASHPAFMRLAGDAPAVIHDWIDRMSGQSWPVVIQHGDLAPWNIFATTDNHDGSSITALDWEFGNLQGAPYFDAAYYSLQIAALIDRLDPDSAMNYAISQLMRNPWPALEFTQAEAITALAAFEAWRTALADGDSHTEPLQQWQRAIWDRPSRPGRVLIPAATAVRSGRLGHGPVHAEHFV
jgi:hypothetical protein